MNKKFFLLISPLIIASLLLTNCGPITAVPTAVDEETTAPPPVESDSSSSLIPTAPENPGGKGFDRMCDPTYTGNQLNGNNLTGALPNAPVSGRWFQNQFVQLEQNAFPPFP